MTLDIFFQLIGIKCSFLRLCEKSQRATLIITITAHCPQSSSFCLSVCSFPCHLSIHSQAWMNHGGSTNVEEVGMQLGKLGGDRNRVSEFHFSLAIVRG